MKKKRESRQSGFKRMLYDFGVHFCLALLSPYFLFKMLFSGKYRKGLKERFGFIAKEKFGALSKTSANERVVWFHAVSVGETKAVMPLVKLYKEKHPGVKVVFSTVTPTGQDEAARTGRGMIDALIYFPLDLGWVIERVLDCMRPDAFVIVEKEYWPNAIMRIDRRGVPIAVVNGTMSDRSFENYKRARFLFGDVFGRLSLFSARTDRDKEKALALGVERERVATAGNLKFDSMARAGGKDNIDGDMTVTAKKLGADIGVGANDAVMVAGSTHAGEEEALLDAYRNLSSEFPGLKLIIAPRHPERFNDVAGIMEKKGVDFTRRSAGRSKVSGVVLLDTMGELRSAYALASVAFVGGTLAPIGGHNLFEPAFFSKPVLFGPSVESCTEMARLILEADAGIEVQNKAELESALRRLLSDDALRMKMGKSGRRELERNSGATRRTIDLLDRAFAGVFAKKTR